MSDSSTVRCMVCGAVRRELNGHIRMHNLTSAEYKALYPESAMISEKSRHAKSQSLKGKKRRRPNLSEEQRARKSQLMKETWGKLKEELGEEEYRRRKLAAAEKMRQAKGENYRHSDETLAKMRRPRPKSQGRQFSEEHKAKISEAAYNRPKRGSHSEETKAKMREAWVTRKNNVEQYNQYLEKVRERMTTPESIEQIRKNVAKRLADPAWEQKQYGTKPEVRLGEWLDQHNLTYAHQHTLNTDIGVFVYDFYVPSMNLLIEVDGEYWHSKSLEQINRDKLKMRKAKEAGLACVRISDKNWCPDVIFSSTQEMDQHNRNLIEKRLNRFR